MTDKLKAAVAAVLEDKYWYAKQPDGTFRMEIYADYCWPLTVQLPAPGSHCGVFTLLARSPLV